MRRFLLIIYVLAVGVLAPMAQSMESDSLAATIVDQINTADGSSITVVMPAALQQRMVPPEAGVRAEDPDNAVQPTPSQRRQGYRIQVFSDNNVRTAKANAEYRKRAIEQRFPGTRAYLLFESPYWRVRVGDYRSHSEAEAAMADIRAAFPNYSADLRIVRSHINHE